MWKIARGLGMRSDRKEKVYFFFRSTLYFGNLMASLPSKRREAGYVLYLQCASIIILSTHGIGTSP